MISIIIPTYNEEKYLGKTLDNLSSLKIPHEIIVTDDKSTDGTVVLAHRYTDNVLVPQTKHVSIAANRNTGARTAQGEFLVFMDSSCFIQNPGDFFDHALKLFDIKPALVGLTGQLRVYPEAETVSDRLMYIGFNATTRIKNNMLHIGEAPGKFQMIRSESFKNVGGFNESLITGEDADLFYRLSKIGDTYYAHDLIICHSGRRAHALGWHRILFIWMLDRVSILLTGHSYSKNWNRNWERSASSPKNTL